MKKIRVTTCAEVEEKKQVFKKILGKSYLIKKNGEKYEIFEYMCRHQGADLSNGKEERGIITCARHQWKYKKDTGENIEGDGRPLKKCPIEIVEGDIFIVLSSGYHENED